MKPLLRLLLVSAALLPIGPACGAAPARPNVLFVIADDLNKSLGAYGDALARSPNVDRLAARAVRFDRAYCQYPVCSPSRVSFLSGRRPETTRMFGNEGSSRTPPLAHAVFMPEYFRQQGYFTARVGKVFHIGRDVPECWDVTEEGTGLAKTLFQPAELKELDLERTVVAQQKNRVGAGEGNTWAIIDASDDQLIDHKIADRAIALIDQGRTSGKPFFVACGFRRPHLPRYATKEYFAPFDAARLPLPPAPPADAVLPEPRVAITDQAQREALRSYLACVALMDAQLGRVLAALDRDKLWDNTIVVFLGDHGYLTGSRGGWWGKGILYDEAVSTTLLIAAPGAPRGVASPRVIEFLDFYPTLAALCGLPAPTGVAGRSFVPLITDPRAPWDHPAFSMVARNGRPHALAVSTERHRLIENADGSLELYDLQADPHEWSNLASVAAHAADLARLRTLTAAHREKFWR
ncbi:MAG: hypothetical protein RLZZ15_3792 [Verrucomicrobiota bacterium]|jgi:uncharacterized sulfatase